VKRWIVRKFGNLGHSLRIVGIVHDSYHFIQIDLSFLVRNRKFGIEKLRKKTESDGYFVIFLGNNVWTKRSIFKKEDDRISTDGPPMIRLDLGDMLESKISFKLHIVTNFDNRIFVEDISYFKLTL